MTRPEDVQDGPAGSRPTQTMWYARPAERWFEALPVGNGRLGGMVYGGTHVERVQLSESTAWSGAPSATDVSPTAREHLDEIRALLFAGEYEEAQRLTEEHLLGRPASFGTNLPLPEVLIEYTGRGAVGDYRRSLRLNDAVVTTELTCDGQRFRTEVFSSHPARVLAVRTESAGEGTFGFRLSVGEAVFPLQARVQGSDLVVMGRAVESLHSDGRQGVALEIRLRVVHDGGTLIRHPDSLQLEGARSATVFVAVGTDWGGRDRSEEAVSALDGATGRTYAQLRAEHVADHAALFDRVAIDLGASTEDVRSRPTDERRARFAAGGSDPELIALFVQFGRYLTIAGSRHDSPLPLALQGLWNDGLASSAPWTNDFHLDMNTQQNYWAAEITALGECQEPLLRLVENLRVTGRETARSMYGAAGWVAHTVTNAWGYSAPGRGMGWGMNVTGGAWIALQHWDRWDYGRDVEFLERRAYPVLKEAAEFFLDYLVPEPEHGWLVSGPSDSPENWYLSPRGEQCAVSMGATCDRVFVEAIFRTCVEASRLLGVDPEFRERVTAARARLAPFRIGRHGQLQEWLADFDEAVPSHRHTSHLMALYPERQIGPRTAPELARAAEVTLDRRQRAPGWEQTEWVEANLIAYYARLLDGNAALTHVRSLIGDTAESNLMTYSAGGVAGATQNIYSFDGNAGATAGIAEMLLQSDGHEIELLPALPSSWQAGSVRGLRARGAVAVDITWRDGWLLTARLRAERDLRVALRYRDHVMDLDLSLGTSTDVTIREGTLVPG